MIHSDSMCLFWLQKYNKKKGDPEDDLSFGLPR